VTRTPCICQQPPPPCYFTLPSPNLSLLHSLAPLSHRSPAAPQRSSARTRAHPSNCAASRPRDARPAPATRASKPPAAAAESAPAFPLPAATTAPEPAEAQSSYASVSPSSHSSSHYEQETVAPLKASIKTQRRRIEAPWRSLSSPLPLSIKGSRAPLPSPAYQAHPISLPRQYTA
jgi:hypothetical protein